jgi:hypothetical protein
MAAYWWLDLPLCWGVTLDTEFEDTWNIVQEDGWAPPGFLLPKYAHYMKEDWCDCLGFINRPPGAKSSRWGFETETHQFWESDLGFRNVDGAYWLMHSRERGLHEAVIHYLEGVAGAEVFWINVEDCP